MKAKVHHRLTAIRSAIAKGWHRLTTKVLHLAGPARDLLRRSKGLLRFPAQFVRFGKLAVARLRPTPRFWTVVVALLAVPLGIGLLVAPLQELATGKSFGLQGLLTLCWLLTGAATCTSGIGILVRAPSYRRFLRLAFACSLPLPAAFAYRTVTLWWRMRSAEVIEQEELRPWVAGGVQLTLVFLAVSAFLWFMLRLRPLRSLACTGSFLSGRAGPVIGAGFAVVVGSGTGYLLWLSLRWLDFAMVVEWVPAWVLVARLEYFVAGGGLLAAALVISWRLLRRGRSPRPAMAPRPAISPRPAMPQRPAPPPPAQRMGGPAIPAASGRAPANP